MRALRHIGTALVVLGAALIAYAATTWLWRDPITDLYARYQQHKLAAELESAWPVYRMRKEALAAGEEGRPAALAEEIARAALDYKNRLSESKPMGRLLIPKIGVNTIFVEGTSWARDLSKGPGHYERTSVPGLGRTTGVAGHRTTFGAPFRKIDQLQRGDRITLELPYGTFRYDVVRHEIVDSDDWSVIRARGYDAIMLSACHPLYSASHRWIVYGRLVAVEPVGAKSPYVLAVAG